MTSDVAARASMLTPATGRHQVQMRPSSPRPVPKRSTRAIRIGAVPCLWGLLLWGLAGAFGSGRALANGAFPDAQSLLTTASRPAEIGLVTNFGLVLSEDRGQSWLWSCEQDANALGYLYQYGAPPRSRLFALTGGNLVYSDDGSCGWRIAAGLVTGRAITDFFPDPSNPDRVLAVAFDDATSAYAVLASSDGGTTFDTTLYGGDNLDGISGVEIARSDPSTIYVTTSLAATNTPALAQSTDGGVSWQVHDLAAALGPGSARIVAVDPLDARKVMLLFTGLVQQTLAMTTDGGQTAAHVLAADAFFTSYARTSSGTILIGGTSGTGTPILYRSRDGGFTFALIPDPTPHIRSLAARDGDVYAATDNFGDGYALGLSTDEGTTWRPLMSYDQIAAIIGCAKATCQDSCAQQVSKGLWPANICAADPPGASSDAGADGGGSRPPRARGGGCAISQDRGGDGAGDRPGWALVIIAALYRQRRRARRGRVRRGRPGTPTAINLP